MIALYVGSLLILIRSVFRIVEYLQGWQGYLLGHEAFIYIFDATLMLIVMLIFNWVHPSQVRSEIRGGGYIKGFMMKGASSRSWDPEFSGEVVDLGQRR
jgi:RTA1 like protein